jgi:hypothetical protein
MSVSVTMLDRREGVTRFALLRVAMYMMHGTDITASLPEKAVVQCTVAPVCQLSKGRSPAIL